MKQGNMTDIQKIQYPVSMVEPVAEVLHGVEIIDSYRWLEDQESPRTREWIKKQNDLTRSFLESIPDREKVGKRLEELLKVEEYTLPIEKNNKYFFKKRGSDQQNFIIYYKNGLKGEEIPLIDPEKLDVEGESSVVIMDVSMDGGLIAYGIRQGGEDEISVRFFDIKNRKDLPDRLEKSRYYGISVLNDKSGFFYAENGKSGGKVCFHKFGENRLSNRIVFKQDPDGEKIVFIHLSDDGQYLIINVWHGAASKKTRIYYIDPESGFSVRPLITDIDAHFQSVIFKEGFYMMTNWESPKGRIIHVDSDFHNNGVVKEIVGESESVMEDFIISGEKIFVKYLDDVKSKMEIFSLQGVGLGEIDLPHMCSIGGMSSNTGSNQFFFSYSSFCIPESITRYDALTGETALWSETNLPLDPDCFKTEQVWYESGDGTMIPMFIVSFRDFVPGEGKPLLMTGYGGFNLSRQPGFMPEVVAWIENGGIFAMPNLRGGGEYGEEWHKGGMLENKQNVFNDLYAAVQWLINKGYGDPERMGITGRSNGGLLVGAAITQRPRLFKAVICGYPLLDMIRYHRFLVAKYWIPEYGSAEDPAQFEYIYKYSPYHNVKMNEPYPAVLFVTGDADTRVAPLHARKMAALLQKANSAPTPILLHYNEENGHVGEQRVDTAIRDKTDQLLFLFRQLGIQIKRIP